MLIPDGYHDIPPGKVAMIVTHLEMHSPAPIKGVALAEGLTFRPFGTDVARYRDLIDRVGSDWLWFSRQRMEDAALGAIISDPKVAVYTLEKNGQAEALLELDFREAGECELAYFGLTSQLIGTGAGRYLMDQSVRLAWAQDITRFHVHTCTIDSPQALSFYIRSGFKPYKQQVEVDDDPRLTGLLPESRGPHVPIIR